MLPMFWLWAGLFAVLHLRMRRGLRPLHSRFRFKTLNGVGTCVLVLFIREVHTCGDKCVNTFVETCWLHVWDYMLDLNGHIGIHAMHMIKLRYRFIDLSTYFTYLATNKLNSLNGSFILKNVSIIDRMSTMPCSMHVLNIMLSSHTSTSCRIY